MAFLGFWDTNFRGSWLCYVYCFLNRRKTPDFPEQAWKNLSSPSFREAVGIMEKRKWKERNILKKYHPCSSSSSNYPGMSHRLYKKKRILGRDKEEMEPEGCDGG